MIGLIMRRNVLYTRKQLILISFVCMYWSAFASAISLDEAYKYQKNDIQVKGRGTVVHVLNDDNHGSRHQKFILKLASGRTILIVHNIDLAVRIKSIAIGDVVQFYGEYEWNEKGGIVHWTHRDPDGQHIHGWLKHAGRIYQ